MVLYDRKQKYSHNGGHGFLVMIEDKNVLIIGDMVFLYDGKQKCPHNGRHDRQKYSRNGKHGFLIFLQTQTFLSS